MATRDVTSRKRAEEQLAKANERLQSIASQDGLTGLANRRQFDETLDSEFRRASRSGAPLSLLMIDVDCFKALTTATAIRPATAACKDIAQALKEARRPARRSRGPLWRRRDRRSSCRIRRPTAPRRSPSAPAPRSARSASRISETWRGTTVDDQHRRRDAERRKPVRRPGRAGPGRRPSPLQGQADRPRPCLPGRGKRAGASSRHELESIGLPAVGRQGAADRVADVGRLRFDRVAQPAHLPAQAVDLVEQPQQQRHRLVVDRELAADLEDQLDPRDVDLVKLPALALAVRPAARAGPSGSRSSASARCVRGRRSGAPVRRARSRRRLRAAAWRRVAPACRGAGRSGAVLAQPSMNSASSGSPLAPITTFRVTYWSPCLALPCAGCPCRAAAAWRRCRSLWGSSSSPARSRSPPARARRAPPRRG